MDKYLKMADVFKKEVLVDNSTAYTLKEELDKLYRVREVNDDTLMCNCNLVAEYAAHAINSHDELVENMQHYKQEADRWEAQATNEASRAQYLEAEVERLASSLNHANSNHELFERQYYLEKDKCDDLQNEVERLRLMISECYPYIKDRADWGNEYEVDLANRLFDAAK